MNDILDKPVGTKETLKLKPAVVKVMGIIIEKKGVKQSEIITCLVKHPDNEEVIKIGSVKHEVQGKLKSSGLWINLDEDDNIRKGSALAVLMGFANVKTTKELEGKDLNTCEDEKGFLCFKAY